MTINTILFPVDFSDRCDATAPQVRAMAAQFGAGVRLLHVCPVPASMYSDYDPAMMTMAVYQPQREERDAQLLTEFRDRHFADADANIETLNESGDPAAVIAAHAERVDLTMLPTHGRGVFRRALLGSVVAKVLHDTHCPVWTAAHVEQTTGGRGVPRRIVAAIDGTARCIPLLKAADALRQEFQATLRLIHVVPMTTALPQRFFDTDLTEELVNESRERITELQREAGVHAPTVCLRVGEVTKCITELLREDASDLLMIGRGHCPEVLGGLRTHAYGLISRSPCPVWSI